MKNLLILAFLLASMVTFAQEDSTRTPLKFGIKSYWNPSIVSRGPFTSINLSSFSPAFTLEKPNGNFYEFAFNPFSLQKSTYSSSQGSFIPEGTYTQRLINSGLSVEYNYKLLKSRKDSKVSYYLGPKLDLNYSNFAYLGQGLNSENYAYNSIGVGLSLTPRIVYNISDRISLDLNSPIRLTHSNFRLNEGFGSGNFNPSTIYRPSISPRLGIQFKF